jgi:hypothetical protein
MSIVEHNEQHQHENQKFDWYPIGKWGAISIIIYYLWTEHRAHVIQFLPFLFILACPLMHFFMHGKHHHKEHTSESSHRNNSNHNSSTGEKK